MKKSLELLLFTASGKKEAFNVGESPPADESILKQAKQIKNLKEKEQYLLKYVQNAPDTYISSTAYLISLIKKDNPQYAYDLSLLLARHLIFDPSPYWLIAEIAIEHNAWQIAMSALEVAKWFSYDRYKHGESKTNKLIKLVQKKIKNNEEDKSKKGFWGNKIIDKLFVLVILFYSLDKEKLLEYSLHLLDIYPYDLENHEKVCEILSLTEDWNLIQKFANYLLGNNCLDELNKNLYLGMAYYSLLENDLSIKHLEDTLRIDNANSKAKFYLALNLLTKNDVKNFTYQFSSLITGLNITDEVLETQLKNTTPTFVSTLLIWSCLSDKKLNLKKIEREKDVSNELLRTVKKLFKKGQEELADLIINQTKTLNYNSLLPSLTLHLSELLINENKLEKAKEIISNSTDNEAHRIKAWIYKLEGKEELQEEELIKYRKNLNLTKTSPVVYQMVSLNLPTTIPNEQNEILKSLEDIYKQTEDLKNKLAIEYGINRNTCYENDCYECCKKTFPYVTYTEYLYLKNWLDTQSESLRKEIYERSVQIVKSYKEKYKKDPPFLSSDEINYQKYYPKDFKFDCPCLGPKGCNVYEAQPFICRAYGYASGNKVGFTGCNYYFEQIKSGTNLTNTRKVIDMLSFTSFAKQTDEKLLETKVMAPIPVWFAQDHELTKWNAKFHIFSNTIFKRIFDFITNSYVKKLIQKNKRESSGLN